MLRKPFKLVMSFALAGALSTSLTAYATSGWYVGKEVGGFTDTGFTINAETYEPRRDYRQSYNFFGGYSFSSFFAVEGSYTDHGDQLDAVYEAVPVQTYDVNALGFVPLVYGLSVFGKMGMRYAETNLYENNFDEFSRHDEYGMTYGLGLQYYLSRHFGFRVEWEHVEGIDELDDNHVSAGISYRF